MDKFLALDLKLSRVASGLSGKDLAHLLGCTKERVSRLENTKARIQGHELASLFLIYGQSPQELLYHLNAKIAARLMERHHTLPEPGLGWDLHKKARDQTLASLQDRLDSITQDENA